MKGGYVPIRSDSEVIQAMCSTEAYMPTAIPTFWKVIAVVIPVIVGFFLWALIASSVESEAARVESLRQYYSACEYAGSRKEGHGGLFGGISTVHMYDCNGVREETNNKWHMEEPR